MFQLFQDIPEPIRQRTLQFQRLPGGRVDEPEPAGVQALARQAGHTVTPLRASLIPILCAERCCRDMMGLSLRNVTLSVTQRTPSGKEKLVFHRFGVSVVRIIKSERTEHHFII